MLLLYWILLQKFAITRLKSAKHFFGAVSSVNKTRERYHQW